MRYILENGWFFAFDVHVPVWVSPVATFVVLGYFFWKSKKEMDVEKGNLEI